MKTGLKKVRNYFFEERLSKFYNGQESFQSDNQEIKLLIDRAQVLNFRITFLFLFFNNIITQVLLNCFFEDEIPSFFLWGSLAINTFSLILISLYVFLEKKLNSFLKPFMDVF